VNSTETTPTPAVGGRQVGQILAGRYRLAVSKGGDEVADVWHALDESTQKVVTLEILRDPGNDAAKQRFLAEARRMAAIERPSVMRVASILGEGTDIFIVFEHLIPLPVVLTGLTAVARDVRPATKAAEETTLTAVAGPTRAVAQEIVATEETSAPIVELEPEMVPDATSSLMSTTSPVSPAVPSATGLLADARAFIRDVMHDAQMDSLIADARTFFTGLRARVEQRFDISAVTSFASRATAAVTGVTARIGQRGSAPSQAGEPAAHTAEPRRPGAAQVRVSLPKLTRPQVTLPKVTLSSVTLPNVTLPLGSLGSGATVLIARARGNRLVLGGAALVLVAVVIVGSPLDDAIGTALRAGPSPSASAVPSAALVPAPFAVPPLSAYGATFESQGPYPTTTPNGTVEWVVALRNTGSAGWHRGIEGAQAALMTPDGAGVAVQSTDYVAPGQVGWFVVRFKARAETGTYTVHLLPRIDGRGLMPELGIFTVVTVAKNP
jgi:hypothetical protein